MKNNDFSRINIAIIGLGFGSEFIPIYLNHPNVSAVAICDSDISVLENVSRKFRIKDTYNNIEEVLSSDAIDAVHIATPPMFHGEHSIAALKAGKHCACAVPMGLTMKELEAIVTARRESRKKYMLMETAVYTRSYLFVRDLFNRGEFGRITFARGAHLQDMERWPDYWLGFPPLVHISHAISPILNLLEARAESVRCFGSGSLREDLRGQYGNPYPFETAIFRIAESDIAIEVSRCMYQVARSFTESFSIYGDSLGFEWPQLESEKPVFFRKQKVASGRGGKTVAERVDVPDYGHLLPEEIRRFTQPVPFEGNNEEGAFLVGGDHGGSHPHLVHEFISSIIQDRGPSVDEISGATWAAAGICAHQSAVNNGQEVRIPFFSRDGRL